jgi:hypothetical protein
MEAQGSKLKGKVKIVGKPITKGAGKLERLSHLCFASKRVRCQRLKTNQMDPMDQTDQIDYMMAR